MKKSWMKKIAIPVGATLLIGIGALILFDEFDDGTRGYQNYQTETNHKTNTSNDATLGQNTTTPNNGSVSQSTTTSNNTTVSSSTTPFIGVDGKVLEVTKDKITLDVPLQGTKTFTIHKNTRIEDLFSPLEKGVLADIDANGELAYHIETDNTMDSYGMIVRITDKDVTIDYTGTQETFAKASNFRIDTDGYRGTLEGLPTEITFNDQFQIIGLEIDLDYEGYDD